MQADPKTEQKTKTKEATTDWDEMPILFLDRLPADFDTNPALAAIASFCDESESTEEDQNEIMQTLQHRLKQKRRKHRQTNHPYSRSRQSKKETSVGELQVFMSLATVKPADECVSS